MRVAPMTSRFLDACRRRPTDVRPVWFMRQAGRYMKQYRQIRERHGILEICKRPDLASTVTLQPVEILDVDAAIIFADLLLPIEPMGLKLHYEKGSGPTIDNPVRTSDDVDSLSTAYTDDLGYVGEAIQATVRALAGRVPVIGFVGAPFTMASYMIEGGASRNFIRTKKLMYSDETLWRRLMGKIVDVLAPFAHLQVAAGARVIQVFDSWVGALGSDDYVRYRRAVLARADRAHPLDRRSGDPLRHRRFRLLQGTARRRRRRDGRRLAHEHRPGVDGHQLPLGHPGQPGSGGAVCAAPRTAHQGPRTAEAHRRPAGPHFQPGPWHSAGNPGRKRPGGGADGPRIPSMKQGVLLVAHGAPERVEDVEEYLGYVRGGRPGSPEVLAEVRSRYIAIGGGSPLLGWTRAQAEALERTLGLPVFFGMRNWHPFLRETMDRVREAGIDRLAAICLAPQFSDLSVGLYIRRTREAAAEAGVTAEIVWAKSYHTEPLLIEAYAERLRPLLPAERMLFTAHSLPQQALAADDPYDAECRATAAGGCRERRHRAMGFRFPKPGVDRRPVARPNGGILPGPLCRGGRPRSGARPGGLCRRPRRGAVRYRHSVPRVRSRQRHRPAPPGIVERFGHFTAALAEVAKRCL